MSSDIFVTNSEKETRGLTIIEASAAGVHAIALRSGGVINTIQDGATGFLYEAQNQVDSNEKLSLLIADANLRQTQYRSVSRSSYFVCLLNPPNNGGLSKIWLPHYWGLGGLNEQC